MVIMTDFLVILQRFVTFILQSSAIKMTVNRELNFVLVLVQTHYRWVEWE